METSHIKNHWEQQAEKHGGEYAASWGDHYMIELETEFISNEIQDNDMILDAGCANGYSAFRQLEMHPSIQITGIDFTEGMIREAMIRKENHPHQDRIRFLQSDISNTTFDSDLFDLVYTTRVLINLPTWELQKKAIEELIRLTKTGGKILLLEGFWEPLMKLNALRLISGLQPLREHDYNRYLKKADLEKHIRQLNIKFKNIDFSSVYYLGSRFIRELINADKKLTDYTNPLNEVFYQLEKKYSGGGFGIQQAYILYL